MAFRRVRNENTTERQLAACRWLGFLAGALAAWARLLPTDYVLNKGAAVFIECSARTKP
jgi:hypothetical protein